jgi:elongation factor P--beta-lysine ligase
MTDMCSPLWHLSDSQLFAHFTILDPQSRTLEALPTATKQRSNATDNHWSRWNEFCMDHNVDPYLSTQKDPVPMLQVFGERY